MIFSKRRKTTDQVDLTVATYNVHGCVNNLGRLDPGTVARVIEKVDPDIVALQEIEFLPPGNGSPPRNQAHWIGERLNMHYRFFPLRRGRWGGFGLALLSKRRLMRIKTARLPQADGSPFRENRGAMWYRLDTANGPVHIINTHMALYPRNRRHQIQHLLGQQWLGSLSDNSPVVFCGDFNAGVLSPVYRAVAARFSDVQTSFRQWGYPRGTFHAFYPFLRLDHIFISTHLTPLAVKVPLNLATRLASDHLPVCARLAWTHGRTGN